MGIRNILVPTDFSDHSETAIELAVNLARRSNASITVLHVDPMPGFALMGPEPMYVPPQVFERVRRQHDMHLEKALAGAKAEVPGDITATTAVRSADPVEGIVEFARDRDTDLIVMGSQGRGATRFLVGSVAEKVSRMATCPVLVARAKAPTHESGGFARVLVGVDYSRFSEPAIELACSMLEPNGTLELAHIWSGPQASGLDRALFDPAELAQATRDGQGHEANMLSSFAETLDLPRAALFIGTGSVPKALLERAEETGADLIVLGAHSRENLTQRILGTTSDRVLRHSEIPVLLVPDAAL